MTALTRALDTLKAAQGEVRATIASRNAQLDAITAVSTILMPHLGPYPSEKRKFEAALRARGAAVDSFHRGLFVASVSSFEGFVKMFISALVQLKCSGAAKFSDLPEPFRRIYIVRVSQVLSQMGSGTVKGIPYNFAGLQQTVGACLADAGPPQLEGDVFTILMGNPTWDRLESLLKSLGIKQPFDQAFGSNASVRGWAKTNWRKNLSDAQASLDRLMDQRNLIVHAASPTTIVEQDVTAACDFFEAIGTGLVEEIPGRL